MGLSQARPPGTFGARELMIGDLLREGASAKWQTGPMLDLAELEKRMRARFWSNDRGFYRLYHSGNCGSDWCRSAQSVACALLAVLSRMLGKVRCPLSRHERGRNRIRCRTSADAAR